MLAQHRAGTLAEPRHRASTEIQIVGQNGRADDVRDRIDRPDLMEMHLPGRAAVRLRLRLRHNPENLLGQGTGSLRHLAPVNQRLNVRQVTVCVRMGAMAVPMLMPVAVRPRVGDLKVASGQTIGALARDLPAQPLHRQTPQRALKRFAAGPEIQQRRHGHVAGDAGSPLQIKNRFHACRLSAILSIRHAETAAPNPLSILTTESPSAQELSIASSGANPARLAP